MFIWTESPIQEIWQQLRYLTSIQNVKSLLTGKIKSGRDGEDIWPESADLEERCHEIASCITQANQYFDAGRQVGLATRPLHFFYGGQALAKAAILANDQNLRLQDLRYHGLSTRPSVSTQDQSELREYADAPSEWQVEYEFAVTNDGVFPSLARITGDEIPENGQVIKFRETLRMCPDLIPQYIHHYGEMSHCLYLYSRPTVKVGEKFQIAFSNLKLEKLLEVFPEFTDGYEVSTIHGSLQMVSHEPLEELPKFGVFDKGAVAGTYLIRRHPSGIARPISVMFAGQFILSNLVRYKPAFWMSVLDGREHGTAPLVEAFCNIFDRRFANDILESIWHERFTYGSPGYLT